MVKREASDLKRISLSAILFAILTFNWSRIQLYFRRKRTAKAKATFLEFKSLLDQQAMFGWNPGLDKDMGDYRKIVSTSLTITDKKEINKRIEEGDPVVLRELLLNKAISEDDIRKVFPNPKLFEEELRDIEEENMNFRLAAGWIDIVQSLMNPEKGFLPFILAEQADKIPLEILTYLGRTSNDLEVLSLVQSNPRVSEEEKVIIALRK